MKAVVSQNVTIYLTSRFSGWIKALKLVSVLMDSSVSKNLQKNTDFYK